MQKVILTIHEQVAPSDLNDLLGMIDKRFPHVVKKHELQRTFD